MLSNSNINNNNKNNNNNNNNYREYESKEKDRVKETDGVKAEDDVGYFYIGGEYKDMISKCFKYGLTNEDFYLSNFDNQQLRITNVVKKYRRKKKY